jgi:hypothetical protein
MAEKETYREQTWKGGRPTDTKVVDKIPASPAPQHVFSKDRSGK